MTDIGQHAASGGASIPQGSTARAVLIADYSAQY
jgi:hypothetical protein